MTCTCSRTGSGHDYAATARTDAIAPIEESADRARSFKICSGCIPVVEVEQSTKTLTLLYGPIASYDVGVLGFDEAVSEPLVRPLTMIVLNVLRDSVTEVVLAERDDAAEALGFN